MYSLLMSGGEGFWDGGTADPDRNRFLEYTDPAIAVRFKQLDDRAISELKTLPALFAYEKSDDRAARLGWITDIQRHQKTLNIKFHLDNRFDPIEPAAMTQLLARLDIDPKMEIHRTHWALKDVDLIEVMTTAGLLISARKKDTVENHFSRQTILRASTIHKTLSHADFDAFLLELGVEGLSAGRDRGGRQARAVSLSEFAVANSDVQTANGQSLAYEIVLNAARIDANYPNDVLHDVDATTRRQFWENLARDGLGFSQGFLVPLTELAAMPAQPSVGPIKTPSPIVAKTAGREMSSGIKPKVFIVHGREDAMKSEVARFIERLDLEAVILHEEHNRGRTLTNKFFEVAANANFAVVLMTPDDVGGLSSGSLKPRARQNVIFELGYFIGLLGPEKVCALLTGDVERPSDFEAVVYVAYSSTSGWRAELARELRGAGIHFDPAKVF